MFSRVGIADTDAFDRHENEEAEARAAMVRADIELLRLSRDPSDRN
jgi:hypothetical protein